MDCGVVLLKKWAMREDDDTHSPTLFSLRCLSSPFQWRIRRQWESLTSTLNSVDQCHSPHSICKWVNCWWMPFVCLLLCLLPHFEFSECCVRFQCFTQWRSSCFSNVVACCCVEKRKEWIVDGCHLRVFFLLDSQPRSRFVSVVFDFNASLNDIAPVPPILLSVFVMRKGKEWIVDGFHLCAFFFHSSDKAV